MGRSSTPAHFHVRINSVGVSRFDSRLQQPNCAYGITADTWLEKTLSVPLESTAVVT